MLNSKESEQMIFWAICMQKKSQQQQPKHLKTSKKPYHKGIHWAALKK